MAEDDYESLGAGYSFTTNALAGASAGYFEVSWVSFFENISFSRKNSSWTYKVDL